MAVGEFLGYSEQWNGSGGLDQNEAVKHQIPKSQDSSQSQLAGVCWRSALRHNLIGNDESKWLRPV